MPDIYHNAMFVIFRAGNETLGINIDEVAEIIGMMTFASKSVADSTVVGSLVFHGTNIPVVCCRRLIGIMPKQYDSQSRILILGNGGRFVGLLVDSVSFIKYLDRNTLAAYMPGDGKDNITVQPLKHHNLPGRLMTLVDAEKMEFKFIPFYRPG